VIALLSDVHGNAAALESVLTAANEAGADKVWFLGDCVGYGARPNECAALLKEAAERALVGNHDLACLGLIDLAMFNSTIRASWDMLSKLMDPETRSWLEGLEPLDGQPEDIFGLYHGSPRDPVWEYVTSPTEFQGSLDAVENQIIFVGHSHIPFAISNKEGRFRDFRDPDEGWVDILDGRFIINPGSVGQPRDGDPRASFALLDIDGMKLSHRRVSYDIERTQREIVEAGLPMSNATRLAEGR
jgi:predicted phosphodiesterase